MSIDTDKQQFLETVRRALDNPQAKYKFIANATPSPVNGEYWTAFLIATPIPTPSDENHPETDSNAVEHCSPESNTKETSAPASDSHDREARHSKYIHHTPDTAEALLGFSHLLLLDVVFGLWAYHETLVSSSHVKRGA